MGLFWDVKSMDIRSMGRKMDVRWDVCGVMVAARAKALISDHLSSW